MAGKRGANVLNYEVAGQMKKDLQTMAIKDVAEKYKVSYQTVHKIKTGQRWSDAELPN
jgi:uncharacterized protein YjcR